MLNEMAGYRATNNCREISGFATGSAVRKVWLMDRYEQMVFLIVPYIKDFQPVLCRARPEIAIDVAIVSIYRTLDHSGFATNLSYHCPMPL
ncbi:hypothetical protein CEXT_78411 [Caerostris extrusa]|uniref:Transposase n=1 Tax=Caerostris extrusa TaxID=172846 RepID=A0AAV4XHZ7_CAEEX|nr:hypothetical protein CEXT_78411 [Caerostris extrusa]